MDQDGKCTKCGGSLEEGFIPDSVNSGAVPGAWYQGPLERSFWTGIKTLGRVHYQVRTYRCNQCGFLESYAREHDLM